MKIRKPPPPPQNTSLKERGLIFQALDASAKSYQQKTGADYTTAWHNQVRQLARQNGIETDNPDELKKWVYSLPLGSVSLLDEPPSLFDFKPEEKPVVEKEICHPKEAFSTLQYPPPWDELAAYLSILAEKVYQPEDEVKAFIQEQGGESFCWFADKITSITAFGCVQHGHPVLCFRGTKTIRQGIIDALILPWSRPIRHMGFNLAWRVIQKKVDRWLNSVTCDKGLILTGHSLGGAMAFLAAYDLYGHGIDAVITFGAPRPAMAGFRDGYCLRVDLSSDRTKPLGRVTHRYTHETDIVSRVPPPIFFSHVVSVERFVKNDGAIEVRQQPNYVQRIEAISTKTMAMGEMLFGTKCNFSKLQGPRSTKESLMVLLFSFWHIMRIGVWGIYFLGCFLFSLLFPLAIIDAFRHKSRAYIEAFSKRFDFGNSL
jgi:hypothetical protein